MVCSQCMEERAPACFPKEWQASVGSQSLSSDHPTSGLGKILEDSVGACTGTARRHQWKPARLRSGTIDFHRAKRYPGGVGVCCQIRAADIP
ncbi:hypothetical protein EVAR_89975_1 [Eumeta japonica]|uniref:Uncharacterized protein n=1 Tax=Eumeta variegata TaxID=151549 RepID=A0A4C2AA48_EUMVA|nr:hypothetical protein EVAR_89975_1 [Eumeta japonica]